MDEEKKVMPRHEIIPFDVPAVVIGEDIESYEGLPEGLKHDKENKLIVIGTAQGDMVGQYGQVLLKGKDNTWYIMMEDMFKKIYRPMQSEPAA